MALHELDDELKQLGADPWDWGVVPRSTRVAITGYCPVTHQIMYEPCCQKSTGMCHSDLIGAGEGRAHRTYECEIVANPRMEFHRRIKMRRVYCCHCCLVMLGTGLTNMCGITVTEREQEEEFCG